MYLKHQMPLIIHSGSIMLFSLLSLNNFEFSKNKFFKFCICNKFQLFFIEGHNKNWRWNFMLLQNLQWNLSTGKSKVIFYFESYVLPPSLCKQHTSSEFLRASAAGPACHKMAIQHHNHNPHL